MMRNDKKLRFAFFILICLLESLMFCNQSFAVDFQYVAPENIKKLDVGEAIKTEGIVIVEPGILGAQFFYINGVQIYSYYKDFPKLKRGDKIAVQGIVSQSQGEKRIKIKTKNNVRVLKRKPMIKPQVIEIQKINYSLVGKLLKIQGKVIERTGPRIFVSDGQSEITIYIKKCAKINAGVINEGDDLEITGILSQRNSELRILPRGDKDINFIPAKIDVLAQASLASLTLGCSSRARVVDFESLKLYFIISAAILGLILIILIAIKKSEIEKNK